MNSRERLARAIAGQSVDRPAVAPAYLSLYLDEQTQRLYRAAYERQLSAQTGGQTSARSSGRSLTVTDLARRPKNRGVLSETGHSGGATSGIVTIEHAEDARFRAEAILGAYELFAEPADWIHTLLGETHAWAEGGEMRFAEGRWCYADRATGEVSNLDEAGRLWLSTANRYMYRVRTAESDLWDESAGLRTRADVDALLPIRSAEELETQGTFEVTKLLAERVGDRLPISCIAPTPFWSTYGLLGFQGMMVLMREEPVLFAYLMERRGRQRMEMLKGLARAGVRYVWLEECLSSADLISPRDYERFAFATAGPYIAEAKRLGLTVILYYCGDVIPRLPWLKRLGMDALAVEESKKGFSVDIADVIAGLDGVCCVFGNVDAIQVVHDGTPEAIQAEVHRQLCLGARANGFVLCQGSPFTLDTPPEKIDWFVRSAHHFNSFTSRSHS